MSEKLKKLLHKYDNGQLTPQERKELSDLAGTSQGKKFILNSQQPEAVFLAKDDTPLPPWQEKESELEKAITGHQQYAPANSFFKSKKFLALAATVVIVISVALPGLLSTPKELPEENNLLVYKLKHRMPQEVIPHIRNFMNEDTKFFVNNESGTIEITDEPENLASLERIIKLIDRQPLDLNMDLKIMVPNSPDVNMIRQAGGIPSEELDLENFDVIGDFGVSATEGRQFKKIIDGRYDVTCFITVNPEATEANIVTLTIYDLHDKKLVFRGRDIPLGKGWTRIEDAAVPGQDNQNIVVAVGLNDIIQD